MDLRVVGRHPVCLVALAEPKCQRKSIFPSIIHQSFSWVTPPLFRRNRCTAVREDAPKAPFATAKDGELAAEALGVADATHGAHDKPEDSMPERELLEMSTSATARVEAPRHQVHSNNKKANFSVYGRGYVFQSLLQDHDRAHTPRCQHHDTSTPTVRSHGCAPVESGVWLFE